MILSDFTRRNGRRLPDSFDDIALFVAIPNTAISIPAALNVKIDTPR
jgi:hypothetical protein